MKPSALLVIDQQKGIEHPKLGPRNNPNAEQVILALLAQWRRQNWPIVHIKHRSTEPESVFWPHQQGFDFRPEFIPEAGELVIEKATPCAFTHTDLQQQLNRLGIGNIVVTGVATNNSVEATARTGGNLGFVVHVIEDGCFCFAKADFFGQARSADEVHAMSLANLHDEYATVIAYSDMIPSDP